MLKFILFFGLIGLISLPFVVGGFSAFVYALWRAMTYDSRYARLLIKYDNEDIAQMVASGKIWTGQTSAQLTDSKGTPDHVEKIEGQEIWTYAGTVLRPAGLRVTLTGSRVQTWS